MKRNLLLMAAMCISLGATAQTLPTPVAQYNFNGGAATDISGNGHNGIIVGTLPAVAGQYGNANTALQFSPNNYVLVPSSPGFDLQQWTISAIVRMDSFETQNCQVSKILQRGAQYGSDYICLETNDNWFDNSCAIYTPNSQQVFGATGGYNSTFVVSPSGNINTGTWYCFTATYGSDTLRTYINGVLNHSEKVPNPYIGGYPSDSALYIGMGKGSGGATYWFRGAMDEVAIFNTPLSATQVASLCLHPNSVNTKIGGIQEKIGLPYLDAGESVVFIPIQDVKGTIKTVVRSIDGRVVLSSSILPVTNMIQLNISDLSSGSYILEMIAGTERVVRRFSKK